MFISASAQQSCMVQFSYTGNVHFKSWKVGSIQLPTASYLMGQTKLNDSRSMKEANIGDGSFKVDVASHGDQVFCSSLDSVIQHVFKGKHKTYPVTIVEQKSDHAGKYRQVTIEISVEKIQFIPIAAPPHIIINFPELNN
jgi:hypothetical protein